MFQQVANPVGGSLALSAIIAALPLLTLFVLLGALKWKAWQAGHRLVGRRAGSGDLRLRHAGRSGPAGCHRGGGVRPVPDHLDRADRHLDLPDDRADGLRPGAAAGLRLVVARPADPGHHHRVLLRRAAGGARRLRHPGRRHRRHADRGRHHARSRPRRSRWSPTPPRSRSARSRCRSPPWARSPGWTPNLLGAMVGRQTPILAVFVPLILVLMVDGLRGVRQTWLAAARRRRWRSRSLSSSARTSSPTRSPTSSRRWPAPSPWCCCCGCGSRREIVAVGEGRCRCSRSAGAGFRCRDGAERAARTAVPPMPPPPVR